MGSGVKRNGGGRRREGGARADGAGMAECGRISPRWQSAGPSEQLQVKTMICIRTCSHIYIHVVMWIKESETDNEYD